MDFWGWIDIFSVGWLMVNDKCSSRREKGLHHHLVMGVRPSVRLKLNVKSLHLPVNVLKAWNGARPTGTWTSSSPVAPTRFHSVPTYKYWDPTGKTFFYRCVCARLGGGGDCLVLWCGGCQGHSNFSDIRAEISGSLCEGKMPQKCLKIKSRREINDARSWSDECCLPQGLIDLTNSERRRVQRKPQDVRGSHQK